MLGSSQQTFKNAKGTGRRSPCHGLPGSNTEPKLDERRASLIALERVPVRLHACPWNTSSECPMIAGGKNQRLVFRPNAVIVPTYAAPYP